MKLQEANQHQRCNLRVARVVPNSTNNGEGIRTVIVFQGCSLGCKGCFSPELQKFEGGKEVSPEKLAITIGNYYLENKNLIDGITLSGGNPQEQPGLIYFLKALKEKIPTLNIWCWTGYTMEEIQDSNLLTEHLCYLDVIITGRFEIDNKIEGEYYGSSNQQIWRKKNGQWAKD